MAEKKLRIGLIGVGGICGYVHYPGLDRISGVEIAGLCDPNADLLAKRQQEWEIDHCYQDSAAFFREVKPEAVVIATPNIEHKPLILQALAAGCHVICEKPMAPSLAECQAMIDAAHANNVVLAVAHCMEWGSPLVKARELLEQNAIGTIISASISASYPTGQNSSGWRQTDSSDEGGGILYDMGSHAVDGITRLLGPIAQVAAWADKRTHNFNTEDTASILAGRVDCARGILEHMRQTEPAVYTACMRGLATSPKVWAMFALLKLGGKQTANAPSAAWQNLTWKKMN